MKLNSNPQRRAEKTTNEQTKQQQPTIQKNADHLPPKNVPSTEFIGKLTLYDLPPMQLDWFWLHLQLKMVTDYSKSERLLLEAKGK